MRRHGEEGRVEVVAELVAGGTGLTRLTHLRSSGVLAARETPQGLYLVGSGANPIGGDRLEVDLSVAPGARLTVRSVGASLARPGSRLLGAEAELSRSQVRAAVGEGATLSWLPEPGVAASGALHRASAVITLAPTATLVWREEIQLGRFGEDPPGSWITGIDCRRARRPFLATELGLGPASTSWSAPSTFAGARSLSGLLVAGPGLDGVAPAAMTTDGATGGRFPLGGGGGVEIVVLGRSLERCRALVAELCADLPLGDGWTASG